LYRNINKFKTDYHLRTHSVYYEKCVLFADSHSTLDKRRTRFYELLNIYEVHNSKPTEVHTAERLVPEPGVFELQMAEEILKILNQIPTELNQAGRMAVRSEIHKLIYSSRIRRMASAAEGINHGDNL